MKRHHYFAPLGIIVLFVFCFVGCGGDDPPPPPNGSVVATKVASVNGTRFTGAFSGSSVSPQLRFATRDASNNNVADTWLYFSLVEGDGILSVDSAKTGSDGLVSIDYGINGQLGNAIIQATLKGKDSVQVICRADILIPVDTSLTMALGVCAGMASAATVGRHPGQGQYLLFSDLMSDITAFDGPVEGTAVDPGDWFNYAEYDQAKGIVFMIWDTDQSSSIEPGEPIRGIIATSYDTPNPYAGSARGCISLLTSRYSDIVAAYGTPDTTFTDPAPPAAHVLIYRDIGLSVFTNTTSDSSVRQINLIELSRPDPLASSQPRHRPLNAQSNHPGRYRLQPF